MTRSSHMPTVYRLLALLGFLLTWYFNGLYLLEGGSLQPSAFFGAAMANPLSTAITLDVYWSALVFSVWLLHSAKRHGVKRPWLYIVLCFGVGLAVAFPLYLASREKALARPHPKQR
jgi:uncharacterized membrane protein